MARVCSCYFDINTGYYPSFHHGIAYLIGTLKCEKHEVSLCHIIDESNFESTYKLIEKQNPDLIALLFTTNQKKHVQKFLLSDKLSDKLIVAGGIHTTLAKDEIFNELKNIDGICIGEGEESIKDLCKRLDNNQEYKSIYNFYFKTEMSEFFRKP